MLMAGQGGGIVFAGQQPSGAGNRLGNVLGKWARIHWQTNVTAVMLVWYSIK